MIPDVDCQEYVGVMTPDALLAIVWEAYACDHLAGYDHKPADRHIYSHLRFEVTINWAGRCKVLRAVQEVAGQIELVFQSPPVFLGLTRRGKLQEGIALAFQAVTLLSEF